MPKKLPNMSPKAVAWRDQMSASKGFIFGQFPVVSNLREHWAARAKRTKKHRYLGYLTACVLKRGIDLPIRVTLTRYSSRLADTDGVVAAFKPTRDGIADAYGVDDAPNGPIEWVYKQELCPRGCHGVRVEIERK